MVTVNFITFYKLIFRIAFQSSLQIQRGQIGTILCCIPSGTFFSIYSRILTRKKKKPALSIFPCQQDSWQETALG